MIIGRNNMFEAMILRTKSFGLAATAGAVLAGLLFVHVGEAASDWALIVIGQSKFFSLFQISAGVTRTPRQT
jgi:hypothetical protein